MELTVVAGLSEDEGHGKTPFSQHLRDAAGRKKRATASILDGRTRQSTPEIAHVEMAHIDRGDIGDAPAVLEPVKE